MDQPVFSWFLGPEISAVGFKTKLNDVLDTDRFASLLQGLNARILVTQRRNTVKLIVSWFNSERIFAASGDWNVYANKGPQEPLRLAPEKFDRRLKSVVIGKERLDRFVKNLGLSTLQIDYEDLLLHQQKTLRKVCSHLSVPYQSMESNCSKATSDDLRPVIGNFEELRSYYKGTAYEPMFEEILLK